MADGPPGGTQRGSPQRGGPQRIPRPPAVRPGPGAAWAGGNGGGLSAVAVADVRARLAGRGAAEAAPAPPPGAVAGRPAAVLCALFDEGGQAHVVLTRRSSRLRSHTGEVSFPGGRLEPGESPLDAAVREAKEEVGLDPTGLEILGRLSLVHTRTNPAPIVPFVAALPARPLLVPNPSEVDRAFTVPLLELTRPDVYHEELWAGPDGSERPVHFFELMGDTVWGATARMLRELLDVTFGAPRP